MLDTATDSGAPHANILLVESFLDALKVFDLPRAMSFLADDVVYQNVPFPPERGRAQVERTLRAFGKFAREFDVKIHNIAAGGVAAGPGVVLTERTDLIRGPLLDLEFWVCGTFEIKNGKITLWRDRFDTAALTLQVLTSPLRWAVRGGMRALSVKRAPDAA